MKVTNWRRKLATNLVACGLLSPAGAVAANLDTNLVVNGTFENVNPGVTGDYGSPKVLDWLGFDGFAYSHQPGTTAIPDYADGADPPGAGLWYFTTNNNPLETDFNDPDDFYQDLSVSAGATGTQIASGEAAVRFSAWMSSYLNDTDYGNVHLQFKNAGGTTTGTAVIRDPDNGPGNVWNKTTGVAFVPVGTATIRVSLFGTRTAGGPGADGYIDNVDVQVTNAANVLLFAQVNTVTGQVSIRNQTGQAVSLDYYEITSASGALNRASWSSLQDQNLPGFRAGNGTGNGWEEGGGGGNAGISESYLTGESVLAAGASVGLGGAFTVGGAQDLVFRYGAATNVINSADFDIDSDVDGADLIAWQKNVGKATGATRADGDADGDGDVDGDDLTIWKAAWQPRSTLVQGFVRYVTSGAAATPEPGSGVILAMGMGILALRRRRGDGSRG